MTNNICYQCRHCAFDGDEPICTHRLSARSDVVTGAALPVDCYSARGFGMPCGPFGVLWGQRDSGLLPCHLCGYLFDQDLLGVYGCPNCEGEGLDEDELLLPGEEHPEREGLLDDPGIVVLLACFVLLWVAAPFVLWAWVQ